ncbi:hypothetical protein WR25_13428 isoform B [Diploscapter pachys]|uniref:Uncharacterized protein n=1 Tax=Diploscapter pachys TaxID=2018661 RepID=A0A2A2KGA1_9BILA|nr:hypothetical protein WR25_13428 isoform B [Diploscapter pachys]
MKICINYEPESEICQENILRPVTSSHSSAGSHSLPQSAIPQPDQFPSFGCVRPPVLPPGMTPSAAAVLAAAPLDLASYIDKLVENLVMHGNSSQTSRLPSLPSSALMQSVPPSSTPSEVATVSNGKNQPELPLSYNQINCLENVHRLLKSQSQSDTPNRTDRTKENRQPQAKVPLTRETLLQHTKKWEEEYRDTWNRRLKRLSEDMCQLPGAPPAKQMRQSCSSTPPNPHSSHTHTRRNPINTAPAPANNYQVFIRFSSHHLLYSRKV